MLVGILSDSHGDAAMTSRAVEQLVARGAERLFHCGDICGEGVLDVLAGHDCTLVWGNCDAATALMDRYARQLGLNLLHPPGPMTVSGKRIGLYHGHEPEFDRAVQDGNLDYLFHGHTHRYRDVRMNNCRVINPGALYRAAVHTVALLDLANDKLKFLRVEDGRVIRH